MAQNMKNNSPAHLLFSPKKIQIHSRVTNVTTFKFRLTDPKCLGVNGCYHIFNAIR